MKEDKQNNIATLHIMSSLIWGHFVYKMKDKIVTKLVNLILNIYGKLYKFDCPFMYNSDEFEYVNIPFSDNLTIYYITWSFLYSDMHDELFKKYMRFLGLEYDLPTFLLSILHEVGHHKSGDSIRPSSMINIIEYKDYFNIGNNKEALDLLIYYNMPDECLASKWAVDFANHHYYSLIILSYILYPIINLVYKKHWNLIVSESKLYTTTED